MSIIDHVFMSRSKFVDTVGTSDKIFISIVGEETNYKRPYLNGCWYVGLFLKFDDCENTKDGILMTDDDAKQIINFLVDFQNKKTEFELIVHCFAGISRSAAIIKFFEDYISRESNKKYTLYPYYNKFIYSKLVNIFIKEKW